MTPRGPMTQESLMFVQGASRTRRGDGQIICDFDLDEPVVVESSVMGARDEAPAVTWKRYTMHQKRTRKG